MFHISFRTFSNAFFLPILPKPYNLTPQSPFFAQKQRLFPESPLNFLPKTQFLKNFPQKIIDFFVILTGYKTAELINNKLHKPEL